MTETTAADLPKVVLSFAPEDQEWADRVRVALVCLGHQERLVCWDPSEIRAAEDETQEFQKRVEEASLAVLLISPNYLTSERVKKLDVPTLLARRETAGLPLIFLQLRPCPWRTVHWIEDTQLFPAGDRSLSGGNTHEIDLDLTKLAYQVNDLLS